MYVLCAISTELVYYVLYHKRAHFNFAVKKKYWHNKRRCGLWEMVRQDKEGKM